jgi:mono/diheme cytochrome c family protein
MAEPEVPGAYAVSAPAGVEPVPAPAAVTGPPPATIGTVAPDPAPAEIAAVPASVAPAAETTPATTPTPAVAADAPYRIVDGRIDPDTVEGWKIYRGIGTCATCHGPVGQGGVGPALVESLKEKITKDLFVEIVANGRDGTMMKPFGENKIVMDNMDNIYAYLKARSDGVLGPENLIKYPLGKIEQ